MSTEPEPIVKTHSEPKIRIGFLLVDAFSSLCLTAMTGPFRSANREIGANTFLWDIISINDQPITASDGLTIQPTQPAKSTLKYDYFFVCAGMQSDPPSRAALNTMLHHFSRQSNVFGALSTGSYMLARAGLLEGYEFTLHWENQPAFAEEFPELEISKNLYVMDRDRWTGSGGLSSMDIALRIIADRYDEGTANAVANQYQIDRIRSPSVGQRAYSINQYDALPKAIQAAIETMMANTEIPLSIPNVATAAGKNVRSLERLFARHLGLSPARYYRKLRLEKARHLLWHTNLSIIEIALMTGFQSPSHLSRLYHRKFGLKPSIDRKSHILTQSVT